MKAILLIAVLGFVTIAQAAQNGSCVMGTGANQVRVLVTIENRVVQVSYEGSEEDKTNCALGTNNQYDFFITCDGETDDDDMILRIKNATGSMVDSEDSVIARLSACRIR